MNNLAANDLHSERMIERFESALSDTAVTHESLGPDSWSEKPSETKEGFSQIESDLHLLLNAAYIDRSSGRSLELHKYKLGELLLENALDYIEAGYC